jgi:hypothetical protein
MQKNLNKNHVQFSSFEASSLLLAMQNAIQLYLKPDYPYNDSLQDLFAGYLHLNSDSRLFVDSVEQSLFDKIMPLSDSAFDALFRFCLHYFSPEIDATIDEYFSLVKPQTNLCINIEQNASSLFPFQRNND